IFIVLRSLTGLIEKECQIADSLRLSLLQLLSDGEECQCGLPHGLGSIPLLRTNEHVGEGVGVVTVEVSLSRVGKRLGGDSPAESVGQSLGEFVPHEVGIISVYYPNTMQF